MNTEEKTKSLAIEITENSYYLDIKKLMHLISTKSDKYIANNVHVEEVIKLCEYAKLLESDILRLVAIIKIGDTSESDVLKELIKNIVEKLETTFVYEALK